MDRICRMRARVDAKVSFLWQRIWKAALEAEQEPL